MSNTATLYTTAATAMRPAEQLTVSEWAEKYRRLDSKNSRESGRWRNSRTPYLVEPMDELTNSEQTEEVSLMFASQTGKGAAMINWIGYIIDQQPGPMLLLLPTDKLLKRLVNGHIKTLEKNPQIVKSLRASWAAGDETQTTTERHFLGGVLYLGTAKSTADLAQISVKYLAIDEPDRMTNTDEGDPVALAEKRQGSYGQSRKTLITSTPTADESRIYKKYMAADQYKAWLPCPHCDEYQMLEWKNIEWPKGEPDKAYYVCPHCGTVLHNYDKNYMLPRLKWRLWIEKEAAQSSALAAVALATGQETAINWQTVNHEAWQSIAAKTGGKRKAYHLNALYLPHGWDDWGKIATEFYTANKEADAEALRVWTNTRMAERWEGMKADALDPDDMTKYCEPYERIVPAPVAFLVATIDTQDDRLEILISGWGKNYEGWHIDHQVLYGDLGQTVIWKDLENLLKKSYDGMRPVITLIDSGGHYTDEVYKFCERNRRLQVWPIKGASDRLSPIWPHMHKLGATKNLFSIGVHAAKTILWKKIKLAPTATGRLHFPDHWPVKDQKEYFAQLTAEKKQPKRVRGEKIVVFVKRRPRNEIWDLWVYAIAAYTYATKKKNLNIPARIEARTKPQEEKKLIKRKNPNQISRQKNWLQ